MTACQVTPTSASVESLLNAQPSSSADSWTTVKRILARRGEFGITRLGSVTQLDRLGIPVVQVIRPASRSVAVNQGKGLSFSQAAISGLMESLEGWASERIPTDRVLFEEFGLMDRENHWSHLTAAGKSAEVVSWIEGWDLFSCKPIHVPLALVDTAYTIPSPHPRWLPRNTTGLAAGTSLRQAASHACFEVLERHARCCAMSIPHFFDRYQIDNRSVRSGEAGEIVERLLRAGYSVGIWSIPSEHHLPIYWCHIMEQADKAPLASWPAEGFGCDRTDDRAFTKALLEACQSRLGIISAARDDIPADLYRSQDLKALAAWRRQLMTSGQPYVSDETVISAESTPVIPLDALRLAGATAAIIVPLYSDDTVPLHVLRFLAPPLKTNPEIADAR